MELLESAKKTVMVEVNSDLNKYKQLPLNACQCVQLVNAALIPRWPYHSLFVPHDTMFQEVDQQVKDFVTKRQWNKKTVVCC